MDRAKASLEPSKRPLTKFASPPILEYGNRGEPTIRVAPLFAQAIILRFL